MFSMELHTKCAWFQQYLRKLIYSYRLPSLLTVIWVLNVSLSVLPSAYLASPSFALVFKANSLFSLFMDGPSELN